MELVELGAVLVPWYGSGAVAAVVMSRRGHDRVAWTYIAWICGALTVVAAVAWTWFGPDPSQRRVDDTIQPLLPDRPAPTSERAGEGVLS